MICKLGSARLGRIARRSALAALLVACGHAPNRDERAQNVDLEPGIAARIGADTVTVQAVRDVAQHTGVTLQAARDRLILDALYAAGAHDRLAASDTVSAERGVLARALLEQVQHTARSTEPTDAEIDELARERWREFDRPPSVRTVHVVVRVKKDSDDHAAYAVAERLAAALRGIGDPKQFLAAAHSFPKDGFEVIAEDLPAVAADGRVTADDAQGETFDPAFARAANAIPSVGDQSPLVRTKFGYHVILLVERLPERRVPIEERRIRLHDDALVRRAKRHYVEVVGALRRATPPEVNRAAGDLTSLVKVQ